MANYLSTSNKLCHHENLFLIPVAELSAGRQILQSLRSFRMTEVSSEWLLKSF